MLPSFGVFDVLSCEPLESCAKCLAKQSIFFFLCSACQLHITFDFPCLQADCRCNLVLSPPYSFLFVTRRGKQSFPHHEILPLSVIFFNRVACSLKGLLVFLRGSRIYLWLSYSSTKSCCQFTAEQEGDFCTSRPQEKWNRDTRAPIPRIFLVMPAWHLASGPEIAAWDAFVSAYPLFSANL